MVRLETLRLVVEYKIKLMNLHSSMVRLETTPWGDIKYAVLVFTFQYG